MSCNFGLHFWSKHCNPIVTIIIYFQDQTQIEEEAHYGLHYGGRDKRFSRDTPQVMSLLQLIQIQTANVVFHYLPQKLDDITGMRIAEL